MRGPHHRVLNKFGGYLDQRVERVLSKYYGEIPVNTSGGGFGVHGEVEPPYQRKFSPKWIYKIRQNNSLVNNAIEEKVNQTFRRGWGEWEKRYEAKCPACKEEFGSQTPFIEDFHPEGVDIDFDTERECPTCEAMVEMKTPQPEELDAARELLDMANGRELADHHLEPDDATSVSQTLMEVLREATWDLESFDDEWLTFGREYELDNEGRIKDYQLKEVHRAPPERMRYVMDREKGSFGGEWWVCIECREKAGEDYSPQSQPERCSECGNHTHEVYAIATNGSSSTGGGDPVRYFIRGEFAHRSLYEPSKYYGFSPIVTLYEETRSLEHMDSWYQSAYEKRRAPRGALAIKSSNSQSTRDWNKKQFKKLQSDPNHIPTLMDDGESNGDPISFISLLESPADMQHMEMREWFKERISAKWGVTPIFQGSPSESGLSQSMEIQVSNRAADRTRQIQNDLIDVIVRQLGVEGWTIEIDPVEEEDEQQEAELQLKHLQIAQQAASLGLEAEWTEDERTNVKPGEVEPPEEGGEGMGMGGMDGLGEMGSDMEETAADEGGPEQQDDMQTATESAGGDRVDLGSPGSGGTEGGGAPGA